MTPMTGLCQCFVCEMIARLLTVKLDAVVSNALEPGSIARFLDQGSLLFGFAEIDLQQEVQGRSDDRKDYGKAPESPPPAALVVEGVGCFRSSEGCNDIRRGGESVCQSSVLQLRCIGRNDVHAVGHTAKADRVKDICGTEGRQTVAACHENQAESCKDDHDKKAFSTTSNIQDP